MCWWCGCSKDPTHAAYAAAVISMVESAFFASMNMLFIMMYKCTIEPSDYPPNFIRGLWAWFFYDEEQCRIDDQVGDIYQPPDWIIDYEAMADNFSSISSAYAYIDPYKNYTYQATFLAFHIIWFLSAWNLLYGIVRSRHRHYLAWLVICLFLIIFDIVITAFYIKFWDDWNPSWDEGAALFTMVTFYLRAYVFEIMNMILFLTVCTAWRTDYKKRPRRFAPLAAEVHVVVAPTVITHAVDKDAISTTAIQDILEPRQDLDRPSSPYPVITPLNSYEVEVERQPEPHPYPITSWYPDETGKMKGYDETGKMKGFHANTAYINNAYVYEPTSPPSTISNADISIPRAYLRRPATPTYFP